MSSILIIDDDPTIREMFVRALRHLAESDQAANGTEALRLLNAKKYGVILLDLHMPGVDGFSVLHTLATKGGPNRDTAVYVISADLSDNARIRALRRHAVFFLTKPVPIATLVGFVESSLRKSAARGQTPSKATPAISPWSAMGISASSSASGASGTSGGTGPSPPTFGRTTTPNSTPVDAYERVAVLPPAPPAPDSSTGRSYWNLTAAMSGEPSSPKPSTGRGTSPLMPGFGDPRTTGGGYVPSEPRPHGPPSSSMEGRIPPPPPSNSSLDPPPGFGPPAAPPGRTNAGLELQRLSQNGRSTGHWAPAAATPEPTEKRGSSPGPVPGVRPPSPVPIATPPSPLPIPRKPGT